MTRGDENDYECEPAYHTFIKLLNPLVLKMNILLIFIIYNNISIYLAFCYKGYAQQLGHTIVGNCEEILERM